MSSFAIVGATVIDGSGNEPLVDGVIVIDGPRILSVGPAQNAIPRSIPVIDVGGAVVMPGLTDCHVHLASEPTFNPMVALTDDPITAALRGAGYTSAMLQAGITSCRDAGAHSGIAIGLRRAICAGYAAGPRIVACGQLLAISGGGKWGNRLSPVIEIEQIEPHVSGPDSVCRAAREQIGRGATAIKLMATGLLGNDQGGTDEQFSVAELRAGVEEAHRRGYHAFAHAHGLAGCRNAVQAGVDSVEHGTYLDEEVVEMMVEQGTTLVPTLSYWMRMEQRKADSEVPESERRAFQELGQSQFRAHLESVRLAAEQGVKIAVGSDGGSELVRHDDTAFEVVALVRAGLDPMAAILAATRNAADLLRLRDCGRLAPGALADFIVIDGNPLDDISVLEKKERILLVVKAGGVWRDEITSGLPLKFL
jgi:imidazolonepropionase-like amidohydrolase